MYFYSCVSDCVFLAVGRDHSANIIGCAAAWQISAIHNDIGIVVGVDNGLCVKYTLPVSVQLSSVILFLFRLVSVFTTDI